MAPAQAGSPVLWGSPYGKSLLSGIQLQSNSSIISGALNPSASPVTANPGSMYLSTNGTAYIKSDSGLTTNWVALSTSDPMTYNVVTSDPNGVLPPIVFQAALTASETAEISTIGSTTATEINGPLSFTGAYLDLSGTGAVKAIEYGAADFPTQEFTIRLGWKPNFTGSVGSRAALFFLQKAAGAPDLMTLYLETNGHFNLILIDSGGTQHPYDMGTYAGAAGVEQIVEADINLSGTSRLFVDTVLVGSAATAVAIEAPPVPGYNMYIGQGDNPIDSFFRHVVVFDGTVHTTGGFSPSVWPPAADALPGVSGDIAFDSLTGEAWQFASSWGSPFFTSLSKTLASAKIWVGNGSNLATAVSASGDVALANTGAFTVTTVAASSAANIHSAELAANAATAANTASTILKRDGSGQVAATTFTGALVGNASTASALAAVPAQCGANNFATGITAAGVANCSQPAYSGITGTPTMTAAAEQNLGVLTWSVGGVNPTGTIVKTYSWERTNKGIDFFAKVTATVAGTNVTSVSFPLPGDMPSPVIWAAHPSGSLMTLGSGSLMAAESDPLSNGGCGLYDDGAGGYKFVIYSLASVNAGVAQCNLHYRVN